MRLSEQAQWSLEVNRKKRRAEFAKMEKRWKNQKEARSRSDKVVPTGSPARSHCQQIWRWHCG